MRGTTLLTTLCALVTGLFAAPVAMADTTTGGSAYAPKSKSKRAAGARLATIIPGAVATVGPDGLATAPVEAPPQVHAAITAANRIIGKPYKYGGGHAKVEDRGYDCSGTVSYALLGGGLMEGLPLDSGRFMRWGARGRGSWITVYTNPGHAFAVIAGLRLDTSTGGITSRRITRTAERGPRWRVALRSARGLKKRHPVGF